MIITEANNEMWLRWRDENNTRQYERKEYSPYFYIAKGEEMPEVIEVSGRYGTMRVRPNYTWGDWESLDGVELLKVTFETSGEMYKARNHWDITYEADISMARKYTLDNMTEIKEYNLRKWYLDIETQVGGRYNDAVNMLCFYDSYDEEYTIMTWFPREPLPEYDNVLVYEDEEEMLEAFVNFVEEKDPDMIIGWYVLGFDIPHILKRLVKNNINPRR